MEMTIVGSFIKLYALFSLATAITGLIRISIPLQVRIRNFDADNVVIKHPFLSNATFLVLNLLSAPVIFLILLNPPASKRLADSMYESLTTD